MLLSINLKIFLVYQVGIGSISILVCYWFQSKMHRHLFIHISPGKCVTLCYPVCTAFMKHKQIIIIIILIIIVISFLLCPVTVFVSEIIKINLTNTAYLEFQHQKLNMEFLSLAGMLEQVYCQALSSTEKTYLN